METVGRGLEALDQLVVDRLQHDQPRAGRTFLPLVAERRVQDLDHRLIQICVGVDDDRVLAAHLRYHSFDAHRPLWGFAGQTHDPKTDIFASREGDQ